MQILSSRLLHRTSLGLWERKLASVNWAYTQANNMPASMMRKVTSTQREYLTPLLLFSFENVLCFLIPSLHLGIVLFFCYTSRQRTYVTNAMAIFRHCLLFSFTEPAVTLPFTWQLLMKSEHSCKLVLGCFHCPINCPPAIIRFKLVIVSLFPFSLLEEKKYPTSLGR